MNIAYIIPSLANKGPIRVVQQIIDYFPPEFKDSFTVYYFDEIKELEFKCKTVKISFFKKTDFDYYDIIHVHGLRPDLYTLYHKRKIKSIIVSTMHNYIYSDFKYEYGTLKGYFFGFIWLTILKFSEKKIVVINDHMKKYYTKYFSKNKIYTIPNGRSFDLLKSDNEIVSEILKLKKNYKIIGAVSVVIKRKGFHLIIELLEKRKDLAFVLVGDGSELESLKEMAKNLHVDNRVLFLGYQLDGHHYMPHFDMFIMSSKSEGQSLTVIESAAYSIPVVCIKIPVFLCLYSKNEVSFFEEHNLNSLSNAVDSVLKNYSNFSKDINSKYLKDYTAEKMSKNHRVLYKNLCNEK